MKIIKNNMEKPIPSTDPNFTKIPSFEDSWKKFVDNNIRDKEDLSSEKPKNTFIKDKIKEILKDKLSENKPCWKGYKQIGMKDENGKKVPNCVPNK